MSILRKAILSVADAKKALDPWLAKAQRVAPAYWDSLNLKPLTETIQKIIDTDATPGSDEFYTAVHKYQQSNSSITMKDGIIGPETLNAMRKQYPSLFSSKQFSFKNLFQSGIDSFKNFSQSEKDSHPSSADQSFNLERFKAKIAKIESGGRYDPPQNPFSAATGKYQFIWGMWKNYIASLVGYPITREEFIASPKIQEQMMDYYTVNVLVPGAKRLQKQLPEETSNLTFEQLLGLIHFKGEGDARKILMGGPDPTTRGNASVDSYLSRMV